MDYFSILMMYSLMKLAPGCRLFIMYLSLNSPVYSAQSHVPNQGSMQTNGAWLPGFQIPTAGVLNSTVTCGSPFSLSREICFT